MTEQYYTTVSTLETIVNTGNPYWNIDRDTATLLQETIRTNNYINVLEIGTSNGLSALYMAAALEETGGHLTTVESHAERFMVASDNFEQAGVTHIVTQVKGHAPEVLEDILGMFDCIFIDATSVEYSLYYTHLKSRLTAGGCMIADNVISHKEKIQDFVDAMLGDTDFHTTITDIGKGILVAKKNA